MIRSLAAVVTVGMCAGGVSAQIPGYGNPNLPGVPGYPSGYGGVGGFNPNAAFNGMVGPNPYNTFAPNYFNRQTQPLSPYLNLLRGGNPAVNYFYGARPGLGQNGLGFGMGNGMGAGGFGFAQNRMGFLPAASMPSQEPTELPAAGAEVTLPPSGHPVIFGNQFSGQGRYPGTGSGAARNGFTGSQPPPAAGKSAPKK